VHAHACLLCAAAEPTCGRFLNVSIADPEAPSPVELGELAIAVGNAITAIHAACFPGDSEVGMMKGGGLDSVGYSQETSTFASCLDGGFRHRCAVPRSTLALSAHAQHHLPRALVSSAVAIAARCVCAIVRACWPQ
jgi:hypothetical protein